MSVGKTLGASSCRGQDTEYNSCMPINYGYLNIPSGTYFNTEFTVSAWVQPIDITDTYTRILEFGTGKSSNNVILMFNADSTSQLYPRFYVIQSGTQICAISTIQISKLSWHFVAATFTATLANIYVDGVLAGSVAYKNLALASVVRTKNYVTGSSWGDSVTRSYVDDIRIYNRALSTLEIQQLYLF